MRLFAAATFAYSPSLPGTRICRGRTSGQTDGKSRRRGAAAVEFALVSPAFVLLILGMIEVGRGLMVQQIITNAAREGAREAVMDGATKSGVQHVVSEYLTGSSIPNAVVEVTPDPPSDAGPRGAVTVRVSVPISQVSWMVVSRYFGDEAQLTASATMLTESEI